MKRAELRLTATYVGLGALCVALVATVQLVVVLGVAASPARLVVPTLSGAVFGFLASRLRLAGQKEHALLEQVAAQREQLSQLNLDLEARIAERTRQLEANSAALITAQRREAVGRLAGGVAHDLNNLLTVLYGVADSLEYALQDEVRPTDLGTLANELKECLERARGITAQLLALSGSRPAQAEVLDLSGVVSGARPLLERLLPSDRFRVELTVPDEPCPVLGDRVQLEQVLLNLSVNARDAMPSGGAYLVSLTREEAHAVLRTRDTGVGMDEATRARAFEAFFTTKDEGKGTGLGLSIVTEIVRRMHGSIDVTSTPGDGATFTLRFPLASAVAAPDPTRPGRPGAPAASAALLVIDDDPAVRRQVSGTLARAGYRVLEAADGVEADRLWAQHAGALEAIVCDVLLRGENGPQVVARLLARGPQVPVLFVSGFSGPELAERLGTRPVLAKPFSGEALLERLGVVLRAAPC